MYGDNTARMRDALTSLMQVDRNSRGVDDLPTDDIKLIEAFRHSITVWCQQSVRASNPNAELGGTTPRNRGPAEELRVRLAETRDAYTAPLPTVERSEEHTSELQSLMRNSYAVLCLQKKKTK